MRLKMHDLSTESLLKYDKQVPRYTSYPTAPFFKSIESDVYIDALKRFRRTKKPLSLYFHIPFCKTMCLFCGCTVVLNRKPERQSSYVDSLLNEIDLTCEHLGKREVSQLHFGGGTPTNLSEKEFQILFKKIRQNFILLEDAEISIEIDPRTVGDGKKLSFLRTLFNRVSFGVQDTSPVVQEAIRRRQTAEMSLLTVQRARALEFDSINVDLIYGLPYQTVESFAETADRIVEMAPDRIALFSYAKVPWLKPHQKAIPDEALPTTNVKFQIYRVARARFIEAGYTAIGMDHFAKNGDTLDLAYKEKRLHRNFQGYSLKLSEDMIGFGLSSIGFIEGTYIQNTKDLKEYQQAIDEEKLPVVRGLIQNEQDKLRYQIIQRVMCNFEVDLTDLSFEKELDLLKEMPELVEVEGSCVRATPLGELFIRNIAAVFDGYLSQNTESYSRSI